MRAISDFLNVNGPRLTRTVVDQMYENPFWMARFGERGRRFAEEDGRFHLQYLIQALESGEANALVHYARWLQGVLTTRGVCTRHLEENFQRLARVLGDEGPPEVAEAQDYLDQAARALQYLLPTAGELQARAPALAAAAVDRLLHKHPDWTATPGGRARCEDDARYHLSYVADAIANARPRLFAEYVAFIVVFLQRFQVPPAHTGGLLSELRAVISEETTEATRAAALEVLDTGVTAVATGQAGA